MQTIQEPASPFFSIITVCLNPGPRLRDTLTSVLSQTFTDFECIVKDGCSSDCSLADLPIDPRVRLVVSKDLGVYQAMNQGLGCARGKYILFLNAGDLLSQHAVLERIAATVRKLGELDLYYTDYAMRDDAGRQHRQPSRLSSFTLFRNTINHQSCYFTLSCYKRIGFFDESFKIWGDYEFLLRAFNMPGFRAQHIPVAGVLYEGGGLSTNPDLRNTSYDELNLARLRHFGYLSRVWFTALRWLTLPCVRGWVASPQRHRSIRGFYIVLRNTYYRYTSRGDV